MNKTQQIVAELIKASSFNDFDGEDCVECLTGTKHMWDGFVWGRFDGYNELITLRDIHYDTYNADTLYILAKPEYADALELAIIKTLNPDEIDWVDSLDAANMLGCSGQYNKRLLRCWWD